MMEDKPPWLMSDFEALLFDYEHQREVLLKAIAQLGWSDASQHLSEEIVRLNKLIDALTGLK